jgi:glycosyltransferase involved in cell wall biosynthesis
MSAARIGVIAIGRNEGERLVRCLESVRDPGARVVYVDSGSIDGSRERALTLGADVVELDTATPFTAARARNAGFAYLEREAPGLDYVMCVDGDCEVCDDWLAAAADHLDAHPEVAVVCGRRRERHPEASVYNRLVDMEWDTPVGTRDACGGDALYRVSAWLEAGGFDGSLIAGEEPEFCLRIRRHGHEVHRIDREMTLHDADMHHFGQWWRRSVRSGHAYAEGAWLHGRGPERYLVREVTSIVAWGGAPIVLALLGAIPSGGWSLWLLALPVLLGLRVYRMRLSEGEAPPAARAYAASVALGKIAAFQGVLQFVWNRFVRRQRSTLIEYKAADSLGPRD